MKKVLLSLGIAALLLSTLIILPNGCSWVYPGSRLGIMDDRIGSLASELVRRDPAVERNFRKFVACGTFCPENEKAAIFAERRRVVKAAWPEVFDRLTVDNDWGTFEQSARDHKDFAERRKALGDHRLRNDCSPQIVYLWRGYEAAAEHDGKSYECSG